MAQSHLEDAASVAALAVDSVRRETACPQSKEAMPIATGCEHIEELPEFRKPGGLSLKYADELVRTLWNYRGLHFRDRDDIFDCTHISRTRPPVFQPSHARENLLYKPCATEKECKKLEALLPASKRHRWFRSMKSSQALAQSVFGNLYLSDKLSCLDALKGDDGQSLFAPTTEQNGNRYCQLEHEVHHLGEYPSRCTSIDVLLGAEYKVAIECKLTEPDVGACSRPQLKPDDASYESQFCDGCYERQRGRTRLCSLSEIGVRYWDFVPLLFNWSADSALNPCPLNTTYQLVRSMLAICVHPDGTVRTDSGHVVLLCDERNPAFGPNGKGFKAWNEVKSALKMPELLQKCTWQEVATAISRCPEIGWLADGLKRKYGFNEKREVRGCTQASEPRQPAESEVSVQARFEHHPTKA
jgi:hypothetical protein